MLMIGDTAGLIHPLCGNGMAMAIHSSKIASELCVLYLNEKKISRNELEERYSKAWNLNFKKRMAMGRVLSKILEQQTLTSLILEIAVLFPFVLKQIIKRTHGKPL